MAAATASDAGHVVPPPPPPVPPYEADPSESYPTLYRASSSVLSRTHRTTTTTTTTSHATGHMGRTATTLPSSLSPTPPLRRALTVRSFATTTTTTASPPPREQPQPQQQVQVHSQYAAIRSEGHITISTTTRDAAALQPCQSAASPIVATVTTHSNTNSTTAVAAAAAVTSTTRQGSTTASQSIATRTLSSPPIHRNNNNSNNNTRPSTGGGGNSSRNNNAATPLRPGEAALHSTDWVRLADGHYMEPYATSLYYDSTNTTSHTSTSNDDDAHRSRGLSGRHAARGLASVTAERRCVVCLHYRTEPRAVLATSAAPNNNNTNSSSNNNNGAGAEEGGGSDNNPTASSTTRTLNTNTAPMPRHRVFVRHMPLEAWNALKARGELRHIPHRSAHHTTTTTTSSSNSTSGWAGYAVYRGSRHHFMPSTEHLVLPRHTSTMPQTLARTTNTSINSSSSNDDDSDEHTSTSGAVRRAVSHARTNTLESAGSRVRRAFSQLIASHTTPTQLLTNITAHPSRSASSLLHLPPPPPPSSSSSPLTQAQAPREGEGYTGHGGHTHHHHYHHHTSNSSESAVARRSVSYTNGAAGSGFSEAARRVRGDEAATLQQQQQQQQYDHHHHYYYSYNYNNYGNGVYENDAEPAVHDYVVLPESRAQALRLFKHSSLLHYLQYKLMCSQQVQLLRRIEREDRRALLARERRQIFLRCLQRDEEGRRNGTLFYVVGRELPQEMVQLFFLLNDQFVPRGRRHEQTHRRHTSITTTATTTSSSTRTTGTSLTHTTTTGTGAGEGDTHTDNIEGDDHHEVGSTRAHNNNNTTHSATSDGRHAGSPRRHRHFFALDAINTRWGDRLLFAGLRPVEGYVVVTVSEEHSTTNTGRAREEEDEAEDDVSSSTSTSSSSEEEEEERAAVRHRRGGERETYAYTPRPAHSEE